MVDYDSLGKALQVVKHTLERLVLYLLKLGSMGSPNFEFGFEKDFLGDARSLRLWEMVKLGSLTIGLSVLVRPDGDSGRVNLADIIIQSRGVRTGGCLRVMGVMRDVYISNFSQIWSDGKKEELEAVGIAAAVKVLWKWSAEKAVLRVASRRGWRYL